MRQSWIDREVRIYYHPHLEDDGIIREDGSSKHWLDSYESTDIGICETFDAYGLTMYRPATEQRIFVPWTAIKHVLLVERKS
jgi:hypothetical protein